MKLRPSEIFFSQDSISNKWGEQSSCRSKLIGKTLDELLTEHISLKDIPNITVVIKNGKFYTADNRRLWIFRKAEELGFVHTIEVDHVARRHVKRKKFTTNNGGISIKIRGSGDPGGITWKTWKPNSNQDKKENTEKFALRSHVIHSRVQGPFIKQKTTKVNQYSFCNNTFTKAQLTRTYKSSYSDCISAMPDVLCDNDFLGICRASSSSFCNFLLWLRAHKLLDFFIGLILHRRKSIKRSSFDEEPSITSKSSFESSKINTLLRVQGPIIKQGRTSVNRNSFCNKPVTEAQHPSTYKLVYSKNNSDKPDLLCDNAIWSNSESIIPNIEILHSSLKRSIAEEESLLRSKSSFKASNKNTLLRVQGPFIKQKTTKVNQYSVCNNTDTVSQHTSTNKSSYSDKISADVRCDNDFLDICESSSASFCNFLLWLGARQFLDFFSGLILQGQK
ncbi:unnamed protein product [Mytilus coruscus]|uniref:Uncharacterized protein n=1 Tax=Mytilus coruscus TaxID=42192 RepID=A0A6J8CHV5_MYTCO|nr:unnamed protein product [Mytilus coruscus]